MISEHLPTSDADKEDEKHKEILIKKNFFEEF